jgi:hypothetical protein
MYTDANKQLLYDLEEVALIGISLSAVCARVFKGIIRVIRHGRRVRVSVDELSRLTGRQ